MKREYPESSSYGYRPMAATAAGSSTGSATASSSSAGKEKFLMETPTDDEQLAALGYKVRASEMADVAQKIEKLEMVMDSAQDFGLLSQLATDTVHYNPSDIATWLESMLSEFNPPAPFPDASSSIPILEGESSTVTTVDFSKSRLYADSECDLRAVVYGGESDPASREKKRLKSASAPGPGEIAFPESNRPVVLVDSQETGIRLVHTLMACAEAVQQKNLKAAEAMVKQISVLADSQAGAMGKVAAYFADALARRIYRLYPAQDPLDPSLTDMLEMHFYETCPYLKFAHFTANQAILEAFAGKSRVHVIDFSMKQGMQWPALMQALAVRPGGPPSFRLTGIGPPQPDNTDALQQVGWKLAQLAETIHVEFEYRGFVCNSLADLEPCMLDVRPDVEAVAVNSVFELHRLLARPGAIEKVLASVKAVGPKIVTVVEQEANHNGPVFKDRFTESLHYYSTVFDSLEECGMSPANSQDQVMSELYLGRQICNVVACEGVERVERHENLSQWRNRMSSAGFEPVHQGSNAFKQASMLLGLYAGGDGYRVDENNGCLMLGWHTRPLITTSAWHVPHQQQQQH